MVCNGWCKTTSDIRSRRHGPGVSLWLCVQEHGDVAFFCVAMVLLRELVNNTSGTVGNQHFHLRRRQRSGKKGWREREEKKEQRLSLPSRPTPALLWCLTCHNHFLPSASQVPTRQPASMFRRHGQVGLLVSPFARFCSLSCSQGLCGCVAAKCELQDLEHYVVFLFRWISGEKKIKIPL